MKFTASTALTLFTIMLAGCAGSGAHEQTLAELDNLKKQSAAVQAELVQNRKALEEATAHAAVLEKEKQEETARLQKRIGELEKELEATAAAGAVSMKQESDGTTISMVDKVLFDSGEEALTPGGIKILDRVSEVLKTMKDKRVRIEGHADSVPIGDNLRDRFWTNWELSTARATSVVHYLEQSGIDRSLLSAAGYADTQPVSENETSEGRASNRRIEIILEPAPPATKPD